MLWYMIIVSAPNSNLAIFLDSVIPRDISPLVVWIAFFGYLFFPYFGIFNGPGRYI